MGIVESTQSLWRLEPVPGREALRRPATCDVCVIGAGIAGLSVAYQLARSGRRVVVLEAFDVGAGETAQTTAHLASALDDRLSELMRIFGERGARLAYESHARAIDTIEATIARERIECDFARVDGYLFLGPGQDERLLEAELDAARRIGFAGVDRLPRAPLESFDSGTCLVFPSQARFAPLSYLAGLAAAVERLGGTIHTRTRVADVEGGSTPKVSTTEGHEVRAADVVVATNSPIHARFAPHSKQAPYRTYALSVRVPRGTVPDALYWDTCDPYHYVRLVPGTSDFDTLIVGGEDQRAATNNDAAKRYHRLDQWARMRFPILGDVEHRWSGQVLEPFDHLAFIGRDPSGARHVYVATGDSGHGLTHGTVAGLLVADLVAGRDNPWRELYDPSRKTVRALSAYVHDTAEVVGTYAQWLRPSAKVEVIERGEGTVVQRGMHKVAMYRDLEGTMHERSAVCTHLGCNVRWNSDEKSWDCRCHGSRFAPTGEVLSGPAVRALDPLDRESSVVHRRDRVRGAAMGAAGGALATLAMSVFLAGQQKLGLLGQSPPKKIVRGLRRRLGWFGTSRRKENAATLGLHWAFGVAAGALFGLVHARPRTIIRSSVVGAGYGATVWMASYYGWVPAAGLMRMPHHDRPGRPTSMVLAHLLFGGVLGAFMNGVRRSAASFASNTSAVVPSRIPAPEFGEASPSATGA